MNTPARIVLTRYAGGLVPCYVTVTGPNASWLDYEGPREHCNWCGAAVANHRSTGGARNGYLRIEQYIGSRAAPRRIACSQCVELVGR